MNIYRYLKNIEDGKAVNAQRLRGLLDNEDLSLDKLGVLRFIGSSKYIVDNVDSQLLRVWLKRFSPATSRSDASIRRGDSHGYRTKTSYFVGKFNISNAEDFVLKCDDQFYLEGLKEVILIENSECYTYSQKFLAAVRLDALSEDTIIILSSGNAISHPSAIDMLSNCTRIYYCPDYDLGGLQIFETLHRHLTDKLIFVMPNNLVDYAKHCKRPKKPELFTKALNKAREHSFMPMIDLLVTGKGILEQEVLIGGLGE
jgi:hypothetical protein